MKTPLYFLCTMFWILPTLQAVTPLPEGGIALISGERMNTAENFYPGQTGGKPVASAKEVEVDHPDFDRAIQVSVLNPVTEFYNGAVHLNSTEDVKKGDTLMVQLWFRSIRNQDESGFSHATVFVQGPAPEYKKYLVREISSGMDWQLYQLPFPVTDSLPAGKLSLQIGAGGTSKHQTWETGGIRFLNYRDERKVNELPRTRSTYEGREADAPWRSAAAERIEKYRKGDFSIRVVDAQGHPLENADVSVEFQRHAFHFGSVIVARLLTGESDDSARYRQKVLELFNQSGTENDLKWGPWVGDWNKNFNQPQTLRALQWLKDHHIYTRGHVMVWPSRNHLPKHVQERMPAENPEATDPAVKQLVLDHIADIAGKTEDLLDEWDVINETVTNHDLMDAFGDGVMVDWFKAARNRLPDKELYLNDYNILSGGGRNTVHQQAFENNLRFLLENDAPVTGIGMQGHFGETPTSISKVYEILNHFHETFPTLDIRITELDIRTHEEDLQAEYTRDFLTIVFSHPATVGVQCWGFWEKAHWRPECAMYTADWQEKPNATAWKNLTRNTWWNDFSGKTDVRGTFTARGFYGDYLVKVRVGEQQTEQEFRLRKENPGEFRIVLNTQP